MKRRTPFPDGRQSRSWRWLVSGLVVLAVVLFELFETIFYEEQELFVQHALRDVLAYGIFAFFTVYYILSRLDRLSFQYQRLRSTQDRQQKLLEQLSEAQDGQEASAVFLQAVRANFPISGAKLLLYNPREENYYTAASWPYSSAELSAPASSWCEENCSMNEKEASFEGRFTVTPCIFNSNIPGQPWPPRYRCPITSGNQRVGILCLYATQALNLDTEQEKNLARMVSEFGSTMVRIQLHGALHQHDSSPASIQHRVARDMHATLGHSLAFLRMKLDQVTEDYQSGNIPTLPEMIQLRDTTHESYQQMRDLLTVLTPEHTPNLRATLTKYVQRVGDRAGFMAEIGYSGEPRPLPPDVLQQIILLLREALGNIEKHARAKNVKIGVDWQADWLEIRIQDDGRGFDADRSPGDEHLGLRFMQERAHEVNGNLEITSTANSGTSIRICIPYQPGLSRNSYVKSD